MVEARLPHVAVRGVVPGLLAVHLALSLVHTQRCHKISVIRLMRLISGRHLKLLIRLLLGQIIDIIIFLTISEDVPITHANVNDVDYSKKNHLKLLLN